MDVWAIGRLMEDVTLGIHLGGVPLENIMSASLLLPMGIVTIVFGSILACIALVCFTIVRLARPSRRGGATEDESRLMQELYQGLTKMDTRIETLETLLLEREKGGR